ncbi:MAG: hypothetical protein R3E87_13390 [Burkholderiaceae bacterium]
MDLRPGLPADGFVFGAFWRRTGVTTDAEFVEIRYSGRGLVALRAFKAIYYGTLFNCVVLAMVLVATVGIAETFLPWHDWLPRSLYSLWHTWGARHPANDHGSLVAARTGHREREQSAVHSTDPGLHVAVLDDRRTSRSGRDRHSAVRDRDRRHALLAFMLHKGGRARHLAIEVARRYGDEAAAKTLSLGASSPSRPSTPSFGRRAAVASTNQQRRHRLSGLADYRQP